MSGEGAHATHSSTSLATSCPGNVLGKRSTESVEQRSRLTAVGLYTGLSLSLVSLHKYSMGRARGGLSRGSRSHTLVPQGDIMPLGKQVTGHFSAD